MGMTDISSINCFTIFTVSTITVVPGGTALFNGRRLGRDPEYIRDPLKAWIMSVTYQF